LWWIVVMAMSFGCGRLGFGPVGDTDAVTSDAGPSDVPRVTCPPTYTMTDAGCYRLGSGQSAAAAEATCMADGGGHLAVIDSQVENDVLTAFESTTSAWIGYVDLGSGFVSILTGATPSFENWAPGDPNGEGGCVRLLQTSGKWDDEPCDKLQSFLCEIDGMQPTVAVP
jgi:hypothetical protein